MASVVIAGDVSGTCTLQAANAAGTTTLTLPTTSGFLFSSATAGTLGVSSGGTGVTSSTGSGSVVLNTSPTLVTPVLGTPSSGTLTSCTGLPLATGVTGTLPVANGGTGTSTPSIVAGSGISVSGSFPNQTITNTSSVNSNQLAKAWVTFNGNNGSTYSSYNVSSVTRNGTADYTLNFTSALANSNYAWSGSAVSAASQSIFVSGNPNTSLGSGRSTTSLTVAGFYQNLGRNNDTDNAYYSIIVIGA